MPKLTIEDLTGRVYGDQEIIGFSHKKNGNHFWNVRCVCGKVRAMQVSSLKAGTSKSCGCKGRTVVPGRKFGRLLVEREIGKQENGHVLWECVCDCGVICEKTNSALTSGTKSCGCLSSEMARERCNIHGKEGTRIYATLTGLIQRCTNPKSEKYPIYGGRGIYVCDEWMNNKSAFFEWADTNGYAENLQIDRRDNEGPYSPDNCRWVTSKVNNRNRRDNAPITLNGKTLLICEWAEELGINQHTIMTRKSRGYPESQILSPYHLATGEPLSVSG